MDSQKLRQQLRCKCSITHWKCIFQSFYFLAHTVSSQSLSRSWPTLCWVSLVPDPHCVESFLFLTHTVSSALTFLLSCVHSCRVSVSDLAITGTMFTLWWTAFMKEISKGRNLQHSNIIQYVQCQELQANNDTRNLLIITWNLLVFIKQSNNNRKIFTLQNQRMKNDELFFINFFIYLASII